MRLAHPGDELEAPGILRNKVPVEALYDRTAGRRVTLRNLLHDEGYESLDEVREEGHTKGREEGREEGRREGELATRRAMILETLADRRLEVDADVQDAVASCGDLPTLKLWSRKAVTVSTAREFLEAVP